MIGETAASSTGGDKAAWIREFFPEVRRMPNLKAWVWFNLNKETDWRFDADAASLEAFRQGLQDPAYSMSVAHLVKLHQGH